MGKEGQADYLPSFTGQNPPLWTLTSSRFHLGYWILLDSHWRSQSPHIFNQGGPNSNYCGSPIALGGMMFVQKASLHLLGKVEAIGAIRK